MKVYNLLRVTGAPGFGAKSLEEAVAPYLPSNYKVTYSCRDYLLVSGIDNAGWTAKDYVVPRLASGMYWAKIISTVEMTDDMVALRKREVLQ